MPRRRLLAIAAALAALALCAPAGASADDCGGADLVPAADNLAAAGQATLCLLNEQRAANGVAALTMNARLTRASAGYSQRMVDQAFFAHESPDSGTLAAGGFDGMVRLYDASTGQMKKEFVPVPMEKTK